jgi:hypothetical protein
VGVQQTLHQEETGREAGAENFPQRGTLWSLKTDAGGEMRRPIIEAGVEEACGKRDGNGEEDQESCGNGDKRPAGIAAPRESGRILSERWKTKETRMILRTQPEAKQGIQFQPAMGAADIRDGSQGSCSQS